MGGGRRLHGVGGRGYYSPNPTRGSRSGTMMSDDVPDMEGADTTSATATQTSPKPLIVANVYQASAENQQGNQCY